MSGGLHCLCLELPRKEESKPCKISKRRFRLRQPKIYPHFVFLHNKSYINNLLTTRQQVRPESPIARNFPDPHLSPRYRLSGSRRLGSHCRILGHVAWCRRHVSPRLRAAPGCPDRRGWRRSDVVRVESWRVLQVWRRATVVPSEVRDERKVGTRAAVRRNPPVVVGGLVGWKALGVGVRVWRLGSAVVWCVRRSVVTAVWVSGI